MSTSVTPAVEWTTERLSALHDELMALQATLNDQDQTVGRYASDARGLLAGMHSDAISMAGQALHTIMLWRRHPTVSPESYLR